MKRSSATGRIAIVRGQDRPAELRAMGMNKDVYPSDRFVFAPFSAF